MNQYNSALLSAALSGVDVNQMWTIIVRFCKYLTA